MPDQQGLSDAERGKLASAYHALSFVESGMKLGLGTGSTAAWLVKLIGARQKAGTLDILGVPTSSATLKLAQSLNIPTSTLDAAGMLDLTIDGADEFDPSMQLIKGAGGALLQEKIVATASRKMVVITDPSKEVATLGAFPLSVEVIRFGWKTTQSLIEAALESLDVDGRKTVLRMRGEEPLVTDEGHYILDLHLGRIGDATALSAAMLSIAGVVETGLFLGIADAVVIGAPDGSARIIEGAERRAELEPGLSLDDIVSDLN